MLKDNAKCVKKKKKRNEKKNTGQPLRAIEFLVGRMGSILGRI